MKHLSKNRSSRCTCLALKKKKKDKNKQKKKHVFSFAGDRNMPVGIFVRCRKRYGQRWGLEKGD